MLIDSAMTPQAGRFPPSAFVERGYLQRGEEEAVSRTYQYRKVMKPMLERKRRARINRCLDELKELMVSALQAEGENVAKLEKADILELTVRHLHGLRRQGRLVASPEGSYAEKFKAGFAHCATEVSQFIAGAADRQRPAESQAGARLLRHLESCVRRLEAPAPGPPRERRPETLVAGTPVSEPRDRRSYAPPSPPASPPPAMWRPW